jgi:hypothetical protein
MEKKFKEIVYYIRRPVDRRRIKDKLLFLKHEYLDHNPERRVSMIDRRMLEDRRKLISDVKNTFWKKAL